MSGIEQVFESPEFQLRVTPDGDTFRVEASGPAKALGFREARDMVRSVPESEKGSEISPTPGGDQRIWYVTEAGFYRAVGQRQTARIKDAAAREMVTRFQGWVYAEVLPAIRRTGGYQATSVEVDSAIAKRLAEIAYKEHVVPGSARVLAFQRWNKPQKGMEAFGQVCIQLELDISPLTPAVDAGRKEIGSADIPA
jgi:prophage antirepressor-like protein